MTDTLALSNLFTKVVARFEAETPGAVAQFFGWREPAQQIQTYPRIVWVPGRPDGGVGVLGPARFPGRTPRPIATLAEYFYVELAAVDPTASENELKQYEAVRFLYNRWVRALYLAAHGTFAVVEERWLNERKERRYGAAIRIICTLDSMIPDSAEGISGVAVKPTQGNITIEQGNHEETLLAPEGT